MISESSKIAVISHIKITDLDTKKVLLNVRDSQPNKIHDDKKVEKNTNKDEKQK